MQWVWEETINPPINAQAKDEHKDIILEKTKDLKLYSLARAKYLRANLNLKLHSNL